MGSGAAQAAPSLAPVRLIFVVWPHGVAMAEEGAFQSTGEGTNFELGSDLRELMAPYKSRLLVPTNIARREPKGPGDHPRGYGSLLTARMLDQGSIRNGVSVDQVAAAELKQLTRLPSLELAMEGPNHLNGNDGGWPTLYGSYLSWDNATTPRPPKYDLGEAFDALFPAGAVQTPPDTSELEAANRRGKSIIDYVHADAKQLSARLGAADQARLEEYLSKLRDLERRVVVDAGAAPACQVGQRPNNDAAYPERLSAAFDMVTLGLQCDATRIVTMTLGDVYSGLRPKDWVAGVNSGEGYHTISHVSERGDHGVICRWWYKELAGLLQRLDAVSEPGGGTLLDNSIVVLTSEVQRGPDHVADNMPILIAGSGRSAINTGRRLVFPEKTPMANLHLTLLHALGIDAPSFGDNSTGPLSGILV
jgi:hypothetical protein